MEIADHQLDIHISGDARLAALLDTIDSARTSLRLIFYIYVDDAVGRLVRDALVHACARGVSVALVIDGFGSSGLADSFLHPLREAGARDVVPEIFEASLSLASQTLHHIGIPARRVRRLVQSQRQTRYAGLKEDTSNSSQ